MKKAFYSFAILLSLVAVFSCNKDDSNNSSASIVGKWTFTQGIIVYTFGGFPATFTLAGNSSTYFQYNSDGSGVRVDSTGETQAFKYTYSTDTKVLTEVDTDIDTTITYNVTKLTSSELQLHNEGTVDSLGATVPYKADLYFKK